MCDGNVEVNDNDSQTPRQSTAHVDTQQALEIEMDLDDPDNGGASKAAAERPQQVSFKKKESERATAARKSTYAYKKSIEDAEPWVALEVRCEV